MEAADTSPLLYWNEECLTGGLLWLNPFEIKFECSDRAEKSVLIIFTTRLRKTRNFKGFEAIDGKLAPG